MTLGFVRPAGGPDAPVIAAIQLSTWRTAYRRIVPRDVLRELDEDFLAGHWATAIATPPSPRHRVLVAVEQHEGTGEETAVGFAAIGPADEQSLTPEEDAPDPRAAAVTDLLVEPRYGRRGHGSRLLSAAVAHWRADGFSTALAWAFEADPVLQTFLTSAGWEADGATRALDMADVLVPQRRLHTIL